MPASDDALDVASNRLLAALPDHDRDQLLVRLEPIEFTVRQPLYEPHKPIQHVYFPTGCVISILAVVDDDQAVEVATVGIEGMIGIPLLLGTETSPDLVFCQIPGQALRMPAGPFRELANGAGAIQALLQRYTFAYVRQLSQGSACNRLHPVDQRCARWLLLTHDNTGGRDEFPLTQDFLAKMLGVRRATVNEAAGRLQRAELISYHRGVMRILDRPGLEAAACQCYRIIAKEYARLIG
jgi:CRP-like cAMP-binding protein